MKRRTLVKLALSLLGAVVAADVALTVFVIPDGVYVWRPLPPFGACFTEAQREWLAQQREELRTGAAPGTMRFDRELGWVPVENSHAGRPGLLLTYDALGARTERPHAAEPAPGAVRVACFGDSFTHGDEVDTADTWSEQLESSDSRLEVFNFGVGGYGTDQALLRMRRTGLHGARVACMGYMVENAGRNVNRYRPWYRPPSPNCGAKPRFVLRDGKLELVPLPYATREALVEAVESERVLTDLAEHEHWLGDTTWGWTRASSIVRFARGWFAYRAREPERFYEPLDGEPYRVTLELLASFHHEARALGAEHAVVLFFPGDRDLVRLAAGGSRYWQPLVDDLSARDVRCLDLSDALLDAWRQAGDGAKELLFSGAHYSRAGNAVVARALNTELAKL